MIFLWLVLLQVIIFAILVLFLRVIVSRNIAASTSHLTEMNQEYTQKLDECKKKAQEADKYYDEAILRAKTDAEKLKAQILKETHDNQELMISDSRKTSEDIIQQANKAAESIQKDVDRMIDERAVDKACEFMTAVLSDEISKEIHGHWIDELFKHGLDDLDRLHVSRDAGEVQALSAHALTADQKALLQKKIKEKLKKDLPLKESVDPGLLAGIKVTLGSVVIDGTLKFKIKELARNAKRNGES